VNRVLTGILDQLKSSHRGRLDIIANILRSSGGGVRKTSIMYKCNLSFKQLEVYLGFLLRKGLLKVFTQSEGNSNIFFETTDKGLDFLQAYSNLESLMAR
jgi:predicted transcriptional regulator